MLFMCDLIVVDSLRNSAESVADRGLHLTHAFLNSSPVAQLTISPLPQLILMCRFYYIFISFSKLVFCLEMFTFQLHTIVDTHLQGCFVYYQWTGTIHVP